MCPCGEGSGGSRGLALGPSHFFENGDWGSPVRRGVEGQDLTAEDQLFILMQAGLFLSATRGLAAPEARVCYEGAEALCHLLNRPLVLYLCFRALCQWLRREFSNPER